MKDYSHIITKITSTPWMIEETSLRMILEILDAHLKGTISQEEIRVRLAEKDRGADRHSATKGRIGVLSLQGPIFPKANLMTELSGATSVEQFRKEFRQMLADDDIDDILLDIDSPGGLADQIDEMASEIYAARDEKGIYAIANSSMNSAAYYIGSQAHRLYATPSAQVGSIGTYTVHTDYSDQAQMLGIKNTVIKAGRFKALHEEPLSGDGRQQIQDYVNQANEGFLEAVARGRRTTRDDVMANYGEGFVVSPKQALEKGMIDQIATFDQVMSQLSTPVGLLESKSSVAQTGIIVPIITSTTSNTANQSYDADKEHSEPGTGQGGEPTPREPPETGDPAIEGGWRRDPPPPAYDEPEQMGGIIVNREQLESLALRLGIEFDSDTSDEDLASFLDTRIDEIVVPLNSVAQEAQRRRDFASEYPEEAAKIERYERRSRAEDAHEFAESYTSFDANPKLGFSTLVREQLESAHLKLADRQFTQDDLKSLVDAVASDKAVVSWGEVGSRRFNERDVSMPTGNPRQQLHDLVQARMEEDSMDYAAALEVVSKENPELAQAYLAS